MHLNTQMSVDTVTLSAGWGNALACYCMSGIPRSASPTVQQHVVVQVSLRSNTAALCSDHRERLHDPVFPDQDDKTQI